MPKGKLAQIGQDGLMNGVDPLAAAVQKIFWF